MRVQEYIPVTKVLVPGRGHNVVPYEGLRLTSSAIARVDRAAQYYHDNAEAFEELGGIIRFEGGWAKSALGIKKPSLQWREGRLMRELGIDLGIPEQYTSEGINSTSTITNMLDAREDFKDAEEVLIVTQRSQAPRFLYCGKLAIPNTRFSILLANGENNPAIIEEEQRLLRQSRILYGWARGERMLRVADNFGTFVGRVAGIKPGAKYANAT